MKCVFNSACSTYISLFKEELSVERDRDLPLHFVAFNLRRENERYFNVGVPQGPASVQLCGLMLLTIFFRRLSEAETRAVQAFGGDDFVVTRSAVVFRSSNVPRLVIAEVDS